MKKALLISTLLHGLAFLPLFWNFPVPPRVVHITSMELVTDHPQKEKSRKSRKKAIKKNIEPSPAEPLTPVAEEPIKEPGADREDVEEIKAGVRSNAKMLAVASYAQELQQYIEQNRFYPRRALMMVQTGTVKVKLTINPDGSFAQVEITEASEYEILNRAAQDLITQLKSFKPLPKVYQGKGVFVIPINYQIKNI